MRYAEEGLYFPETSPTLPPQNKRMFMITCALSILRFQAGSDLRASRPSLLSEEETGPDMP